MNNPYAVFFINLLVLAIDQIQKIMHNNKTFYERAISSVGRATPF